MRRKIHDALRRGETSPSAYTCSGTMIKLSPVLGVLLTALFFLPWGAAAQKDFPSFRDEQVQSFQEFVKQSNAELRQYCRKVRKAFSEYRRKAAAVWGEEGAAVPGRKQWVSYRREMRERFMVDFKQGRARYEVALKPGEKRISDAVKSRLEASIVDSITRGPDQRSIQKIAADPDRVEPGGAPLLKGLFATRSGKPVTPDNARKFARRMVNRHAKRSRVKGEDGRSRVVASVKIPMIPDHLRKRAQKYEHIVKEQARIRSLDPELVFSIIETESYFNPQARSPVPAFGLMQLVPVTGGKEAYRIVYGEDKQPSQELLYQPEANVTLGSAYFQRLYFTYMKGIQNDRSRLWCAIASYNTGPSNLYRTFSEKGKDQAIRRINSMSSEEVYRYLVNNLPYRETRNYVKKVRKKMPKYKRL